MPSDLPDTLQIVVSNSMAEEVERRFPDYILVKLPDDAQGEDDLPCYILTPSVELMNRIRASRL